MQEERPDKPIYGPDPVEPEHTLDPDLKTTSPMLTLGRFLIGWIKVPTYWIRENIVLPNKGPKYYWYHRKYPRVLPIDECYRDDFACIREADLEYKRNRVVDRQTLNLLRYRRDTCLFWLQGKYYDTRRIEDCQDHIDTYDREETNYFIKYGEMERNHTVVAAYMRQKHRMIVERRKAARHDQPEEQPSRN